MGRPARHPAQHLVLQLETGGKELVERRVEQPDHHGQSIHRLEQALEVADLLSFQVAEGRLPLGRIGGEDHPLDDGEPFAEEHVLGPGQPDALGAVTRGRAWRLLRCRRWP